MITELVRPAVVYNTSEQVLISGVTVRALDMVDF
jgi:hypothetical protein